MKETQKEMWTAHADTATCHHTFKTMRSVIRHRSPVDEQTRKAITADVLGCIRSMREENDKLRKDVQRLTDMISYSPALAPSYVMSQPRQLEDHETYTPAPISKLTAHSGHQDPRQRENVPQVQFSDEYSSPQHGQHDPSSVTV